LYIFAGLRPLQNKLNNAKVLLFGEYSLLVGSMALSIPFSRFHGRLVLHDETEQTEESRISNAHIERFLSHLLHLEKEGNLAISLDTNRLAEDIEAGLWFDSNIPQGYGLGSSGSLVAAIFEAYGEQPVAANFQTPAQLLQLKSFFALLESYFHGTSSGLDPLISFLNKAVLISGKDEVETVDLKRYSKNGTGAVFLIDSGSAGDTQPLVDYFKKNYADPGYRKKIDDGLIPLVNRAIQSYISGETETLLATVKKLSALQMDVLKKMIPESVIDIWQAGLESGDYYLKLCGSGGGGMILGFTNDSANVLNNLSPFNPIIIHRL